MSGGYDTLRDYLQPNLQLYGMRKGRHLDNASLPEDLGSVGRHWLLGDQLQLLHQENTLHSNVAICQRQPGLGYPPFIRRSRVLYTR